MTPGQTLLTPLLFCLVAAVTVGQASNTHYVAGEQVNPVLRW